MWLARATGSLAASGKPRTVNTWREAPRRFLVVAAWRGPQGSPNSGRCSGSRKRHVFTQGTRQRARPADAAQAVTGGDGASEGARVGARGCEQLTAPRVSAPEVPARRESRAARLRCARRSNHERRVLVIDNVGCRRRPDASLARPPLGPNRIRRVEPSSRSPGRSQTGIPRNVSSDRVRDALEHACTTVLRASTRGFPASSRYDGKRLELRAAFSLNRRTTLGL